MSFSFQICFCGEKPHRIQYPEPRLLDLAVITILGVRHKPSSFFTVPADERAVEIALSWML